MLFVFIFSSFFFFNDTATTEIYTLPYTTLFRSTGNGANAAPPADTPASGTPPPADRKSTRLNSSHGSTSYAVFCLKKKTSKIDCAGKATRSRGWHGRLPLHKTPSRRVNFSRKLFFI